MDKLCIDTNAMEFSYTGTLPDRLLLVSGQEVIRGIDGRTFLNTTPDAVIAAFKSRGRQLPIDIEHSTQLQGAKGLPAPAVGWISNLELDGSSIYGLVDWTEEGKALISEKKYKYYSPAYAVTDNNEIRAVVSIGLTNVPNLQLPAMNRREDEGKGEDMELKTILNAFSLPQGATEADVVVAINQERQDAQTKLETALNRAEAAEQKLAAYEADNLKTEINSAVEKAVSDGKITPAQKDYFTTSVKTREELNSFNAYVEKLPQIIPGKEPAVGGKADEKTELNAEQAELAKQFGISDEEFKKAQEENA